MTFFTNEIYQVGISTNYDTRRVNNQFKQDEFILLYVFYLNKNFVNLIKFFMLYL